VSRGWRWSRGIDDLRTGIDQLIKTTSRCEIAPEMLCRLREWNQRLKTGQSDEQERSQVNARELAVRDHWDGSHK